MLKKSEICLQEKLIKWFVLLGPLGSLLTPRGLPKSFRFYYFLLPLFPLFFLNSRRSAWQICSIFSPFFLYCFFSVLFVKAVGVAREEDQVLRFCLLFAHFSFVVGAAYTDKIDVASLIVLYVRSFFIVLLLGYVFFLGYYSGYLPLDLIDRFSILTQFGYGLLRFSPGSYPNEFGVVSSFVLSISLLMSSASDSPAYFSKRPNFLRLIIVLTFGALVLATTRAAYLSLAISLLYLYFSSFKKAISVFLLFAFSFFTLLQAIGFSVFSIVFGGFLQKIDEGSLGDRYFAWIDAWNVFREHCAWGVGFGAFPQLHNVYLSFLFELGLVGIFLLLATLRVWSCLRAPAIELSSSFVGKVKTLGLIHVFWFAASNHNLHHHLTWFVLFLYFSCLQNEMVRQRIILVRN
ncbi:MAG: O-antigen ligase family protein [Chlamydiales bacterium]|nr:O-antigen ligase family protein [Chlamydiales bacterium]